MTRVQEIGRDVTPSRYIYGAYISSYVDDMTGDNVREVVPFPVTKVTLKFIFYVREYDRTGRIDREAFERDGQIRTRHYWHKDWHLFAAADDAERYISSDGRTQAERGEAVRALRMEMADAHPDRGGTPEGFMAARARYERAANGGA